ncbi:hypothetical protein CR513_48361, partial [Mucuna pruriens]
MKGSLEVGDFYVLDMEDETSAKGSTLILGRPFLMTTGTKIDVHVGTFSIEFGDTLVQFNIFEAMKHPTEDHSLFGIYLIDELVEEFFQLDRNSEEISNLAEDTELIGCLGSPKEKADYDEVWEVHNLSNFENDNIDLADLSQNAELIKLSDQVCKYGKLEYADKAEVQVAETKKSVTTHVATMLIAEYESAKRTRDQEGTEVISAKKTSVKASLHEQVQAEIISAKEDQTQARVESISAKQGKNLVPSRSGFSATQGAESTSKLTLTNSTQAKRSRPQQQRPRSCRHTWC